MNNTFCTEPQSYKITIYAKECSDRYWLQGGNRVWLRRPAHQVCCVSQLGKLPLLWMSENILLYCQVSGETDL